MKVALLLCIWSQLIWVSNSWRNPYPKIAFQTSLAARHLASTATRLHNQGEYLIETAGVDVEDLGGPKSCGGKKERTSGRGWFPVLATDAVDATLPISLEIAGDKYVIWQNPQERDQSTTKGWNVMIDACPHRLAPLSEGRVDAQTRCLECPYHGWQFQSNTGTCTRIPQRAEAIPSSAAATTSVQSFSVHLTAGLLWAYLPILDSNVTYDALPETIIPELMDPTRSSVVSRDLPYSFDFTIENFMDPAHIPFAHHSLQGVREDGSPIPMNILTNVQQNQTHIEVEFFDKIRNKSREGIVSFAAPCYYHFRTLNQKTGEYTKNLIILVVPVGPGRSRIFLSVKLPNSWVFQRFPKWFMHGASMKFLDSDLWIHDQERLLRAPRNSFTLPTEVKGTTTTKEEGSAGDRILKEYVLMSSSDKGCIIWRKWWSLNLSHSPIFGFGSSHENLPMLNKAEQRSHFLSHSKNCKHCLQALKTSDAIESKVAPVVSSMLFAVGMAKMMLNLNRNMKGRALIWALVAVLTSSATQLTGKGISSYIQKLVIGPDDLDKISAAQFVSKEKKIKNKK